MSKKVGCGLVLGVLLILFSGLLVFLAIDDDPPNDSDLVYKHISVNPEENGFDTFCDAGTVADQASEQATELLENWDSEKATALIAANREAFELWRKALAYPSIQVEEIKSFDTLLPYLSRWRNLARIISIRARLKIEQGDLNGGFTDCLEILKFGHKQETASGGLINYLVAIAIKAIALERLDQIINEHHVPAGVLRSVCKDTAQFACRPTALKPALQVEYLMARRTVLDLHSGKLKSDEFGGRLTTRGPLTPLVFKKNATLALFAEHYRKLITNCDLRFQDRQAFVFNRKKPVKLMLSGNMAGEMLYSLLMPVLEKAIVKTDRLNTQLATTRLRLAIRAYQEEHKGQPPNTLADLVPQYINTLPDDPFAAKPSPISHSKTKGVIYTVGTDGTDDGGMTVAEIEGVIEDGPHRIWQQADPSFKLAPYLKRDSHLIYQRARVPESENAFTLYYKAGELAQRSAVQINELQENWDPAKAKVLLDSQAKTLEIWEEARLLPRLQAPETKVNTTLGYLNKWRTLARLVCTKARQLAHAGQADEALDLCVEVVRFGNRIEMAGGPLITYLVASAVKGIALHSMREIALKHEVSSEYLVNTNATVAELRSSIKGVQDAVRAEYGLIRSGRLSTIKTSDSDKKIVDEVCLVVTDHAFRNAGKRHHARDWPAWSKERIKAAVAKQAPLERQVATLIVIQRLLPVWRKVLQQRDRNNAQLGATLLLIAIRSYQTENKGELPDSLNRLINDTRNFKAIKHIDSLPDDPFSPTPQPLRYSKEKKLIYSVGIDGVNDGGGLPAKGQEIWKTKDPSFSIEAKKGL